MAACALQLAQWMKHRSAYRATWTVMMFVAAACQPLPPEAGNVRDPISDDDVVTTKDGKGVDTDDDGIPDDEDETPQGPGSSRDGGLAGGLGSRCTSDTDDPSAAEALRAQVEFLASNELGGRTPGTQGDVLARKRVEDTFRCLGLTPGADDGGFQQPFTNSGGAKTANVIGFIAGADPVVGNEILIVAAHHDHYGQLGGEGLRLGANDNASGTAGVLAIAEMFKHRATPPKRTVALITFGAEETLEDFPFVEGSAFYVAHAPKKLPVARIVHVTNLDMIGTYDDQSIVDVMGTAPGMPGRSAIQTVLPKFPGFKVRLNADYEEGDSDFDPFCRKGIPFVGFYTEDSECYHKACDTADHLDYVHMSTIVKLAFELTAGLADTTNDLVATKQEVGCEINP